MCWSRTVAGLSALVLSVILASCGGSPAPQDLGQSSSESVSSAPTSEAPQQVTGIDLPAGQEFRRNDSTVYSGCSGEVLQQAEAPGDVFDVSTGSFVGMPAWPVDSGTPLVAAGCTVTTVAGKPRLIYVVATSTPSQGLNPETEQAQLYSYDLGSTEPATVSPLPPGFQTIRNLVPTNGGVYVIAGDFSVALLDATTLAVKTQFPTTSDERYFFNYDGMALAYPDEANGTVDVRFMNNVDGAEVGVFTNAIPGAPVVVTDHGFLLSHNMSDDQGTYYFDSKTNALVPEPVASGYVATVDYDNDMTAIPDGCGNPQKGNQYGDVVLMYGVAGPDFPFITVYDTAAKKQLFNLSGEQYANLNITCSLVGGNYLFMSKEPDNPVFDLATGQQVSSDWKLRAAVRLADGRVLVQNGGRSADGSGLPEFTLERSESGDYDGPWF